MFVTREKDDAASPSSMVKKSLRFEKASELALDTSQREVSQAPSKQCNSNKVARDSELVLEEQGGGDGVRKKGSEGMESASQLGSGGSSEDGEGERSMRVKPVDDTGSALMPHLAFAVGVGESKGKPVGKSWKRIARLKGDSGPRLSGVPGESALGGKRDRIGDCEMPDVEVGKKIHVCDSFSGLREAVVAVEQPLQAQ